MTQTTTEEQLFRRKFVIAFLTFCTALGMAALYPDHTFTENVHTFLLIMIFNRVYLS